MKEKRSLIRVMIGVATLSVFVLIVLCTAIFTSEKEYNESTGAIRNFEPALNPVRMIVYAADLSEPTSAPAVVAVATEPAVAAENDINPEDTVITANLDALSQNASISIAGAQKANKVKLAVWSENGGQDDLIWYDMTRADDGSFEVKIPIKKHHTEGLYKADAYVVRTDKSKYQIAGTEFNIEGPKLQSASFENVNNKTGDFSIKIDKATSISGATHAKVKVYSVKEPKKSYTYEADLGADGSVVLNGNVSNHNYTSGEYCGEVIVKDKNNIEKNLLKIKTTFDLPGLYISHSFNSEGTIVELNVSNLLENSVSSMNIEVYSKENGKDDLVSYPATSMSASSYKANVVLSNHHTAGTYQADVYGIRKNNERVNLGSITFDVEGPKAGTISVSEKNEDKEYFKVLVSGASSKTEIKEIRFKVERSSDGKITYYDGETPSSGNSEILVDIKNQTESVENYSITPYIKDLNGIEVIGNTVGVTMNQLNVGRYKIMGDTRTTVAQMVRYFNSNGTYPSYYAGTEAPNIEKFCQIYYDEAIAEGVKAEVAFCQAMKETGYLKFGGDVSIGQFNFAGIGATGGGAAGNSFSSVTEGIRAQIQHLKAYASTSALNKACVDPRFNYVKRGSAVYVEWLGIRENPSGGGWAAGEGYGPSIVNNYIKKLFSN